MMNERDLIEELLASIEEEEAKNAGLDKPVDQIPVTIDRKTAEIYLKFYKKLMHQADSINEFCDNYIDDETNRINAYRDKMVSKINKQAEFFRNSLKFYAENNPPLTGKTLELVEGSLSFRKVSEKFNHDDKTIVNTFFGGKKTDERFFDDGPKKFSWTKFKNALEVNNGQIMLDGKIVEGVTISPAEEKFIIS